MTIPNEFYFSLPDFKYDKLSLLDIAKSRLALNSSNVPDDDTYWDKLSNDDISKYTVVSELISRIFPQHRTGWVGFLRCPPNFHLHPHLDKSARKCSFIFPLSPDDPAGISWTDGQHGKILAEYDYKSPAIINTELWHQVRNDSRERINFQISILPLFNDTVELIQTGKFFV
jgi:hypothetical protein